PGGGPLGDGNSPDPHADDAFGSRQMYGTIGIAEDVAASAFWRTSPGNSAPIPAPLSVSRGGTTKVYFTISNRGTLRENNVRVYFYLSQYPFVVESSSIWLGAVDVPSMDPGYEGDLVSFVTIPATVAPGTYYLGVKVDGNHTIPEVNEANNSVVFLSPTTVY